MENRTPFKGEGFEVVCPNCRGRFHKTTAKFDNTKPTTGDMLTLHDKYGKKGFNWSTFPESPGMRAGDLECPQCGALYCQGGFYLKSIDPIPGYTAQVELEEKPNTVQEKAEEDFTCKNCGKVCKSAAGLKSHMKSCSKKVEDNG